MLILRQISMFMQICRCEREWNVAAAQISKVINILSLGTRYFNNSTFQNSTAAAMRYAENATAKEPIVKSGWPNLHFLCIICPFNCYWHCDMILQE